MRVTPAGTNTLSMELDCGESDENMVLRVVRVGGDVPELARQLKEGSRLTVIGRLWKARTGTSVEVLADCITVDT